MNLWHAYGTRVSLGFIITLSTLRNGFGGGDRRSDQPPDSTAQRCNRESSALREVKEAAAYIGRTEQALQHLIHKREIVVVRKGRRVHLDRNDLDRWIEANKE